MSQTQVKNEDLQIQIVGWKKTFDTILCKILINKQPKYFGIRNANFPVPDGIYKALLFKGNHPHVRIVLVGVQHHSGVEIHEGNKAKDVDGCTCVGRYYSDEYIMHSVEVLDELTQLVAQYKTCTVELACSLFYNKPAQANKA